MKVLFDNGILKLTDTGSTLLIEYTGDREDLEGVRDFAELMDMGGTSCAVGNGWELLDPAEIGALTSGDIITNDCTRDEKGKLLQVGRVYWDMAYETRDTVEELRQGRAVEWVAHD